MALSVKRKLTAAKKAQYAELIALVGKVITEWDPYALLAGGSPRDEFDGEVAAIVKQLPRVRSADDATHAISRVFSSSFEPAEFAPEACADVGNRLFAELRNHGFIK